MHGKVLVLTVTGASMVSMGVGIFAGAYFTQKRLTEEYDVRLKVELVKSKEYYTKLAKREEYADPVEVATKIVSEEEYVPEEKDEESEEPIHTQYSQFDYRREIPKREGKKRYVVSFDEFKENPKDYDQRTFTYYEKDDVLVDERDTPVDDMDGIVGLESFDQFGNGSNDPNIVYVVNDFLSMGFEIIREMESYEETVLGSIKHSNHRRPKKFRIDDD